MLKKVPLVAWIALTALAPVGAEDLSKEFRKAFEQTFKEDGTYAVTVQPGIPTTSVYGVDREQDAAHYSIDIVDGNWKTSGGLFDSDQTAVDFLREGELLELKAIRYKNNRVDLRFESLETHTVEREGFLAEEQREPVATNFKFFLPFPKQRRLGPSDIPEVNRYIGAWLRVFDGEEPARRFAAARLLRGPREGATPEAAAGRGAREDVQPGMTALQVIELMGLPGKELVAGHLLRWTYDDATVVFEAGRVRQVVSR